MERGDFEQWKSKEVARLLALVESERRYYQEMVAALPVALVVLSGERTIVSANRAFRQMFGVRTEDLRRKSIDQILPAPQLIERIRDAHLNPPSQPDLLLELNQHFWRVAIVPIRNWDDESELETLLMLQDMSGTTTPVRAVAQPAAAPAGIPAVLWHVELPSMGFTSVSGAVEQLLGFPADHWLKHPRFFEDRIHTEDRAAAMAFYQAAAAQPGDASTEFRAVTASGGVVWCRETVRVAADRRSMSGVVTDVGLRRQLEQQLLAAGRTQALERLAGRLAHDLNNPLMIITGYGEEMLQALPAGESAREDIGQILGATERIAAITSQLLNFTRRAANPAQPVDLASFFAGIEEKMAQAAGVNVEVARADMPVVAMADPAQLEEVVLALISGAREDAKERTSVKIAFEPAVVAEHVPGATLTAGVYARITIRDDGRGMDAAKHAAVFESLLARRDTELDAGPAIAHAYSLVRGWAGDIAFASEPFRGSTFTMYLLYTEPAAPEPVAAPVEESAAVETPAPVVEEAPRETILLVEDEPGIRALVRKILRRERYQVIEAGSGEEALNAAAAHEGRINLLITDVMLPGISGRDLAEGMREWLPNLQVLYVSGYSNDQSVHTGDFPTGSRFLQKPFTLSALVTKVREALDGVPSV
jgi:two-component system, cell cycle sensor histidine kinase and response regulator CckA